MTRGIKKKWLSIVFFVFVLFFLHFDKIGLKYQKDTCYLLWRIDNRLSVYAHCINCTSTLGRNSTFIIFVNDLKPLTVEFLFIDERLYLIVSWVETDHAHCLPELLCWNAAIFILSKVLEDLKVFWEYEWLDSRLASEIFIELHIKDNSHNLKMIQDNTFKVLQ